MSKQRKMVTTTEDTQVLERARKVLRMGQVVHYQGKNLKKIKGGWDEVSEEAYTNILIVQV